MANWTRYQQVFGIDNDEGERVCAGHVKRQGKQVALLCQTDHNDHTVYGIPHRAGNLIATDHTRFDWGALNALCKTFGAEQLPNNYCPGTVIELPANPSAFIRKLGQAK